MLGQADDQQEQHREEHGSGEHQAEVLQAPGQNAVSAGRAAKRAAISPKAVRAPVVETTSAVAVPLTTEVPRNTMLAASGCVDAAARVTSFSIGRTHL